MSRSSATAVAQLRALTYRISSAQPTQLPTIALQISGAIWNCRDILSSPASSQRNSDVSTALHRFRTQLSTLLQSRSVEGRWSGVVLAKATIEAGGLEILSASNAWVRSLLAILKKPDPPTTRNLAIITLTRIFALTWDHPALIREITTPALSTFIPSCLNAVDSKSCTAREIETVLEAFIVLVPKHPTIFRLHDSVIELLLKRVLSGSISGYHSTTPQQVLARRLWALLPFCTPKQGGGEKWEVAQKAITHAIHATADRVFRSVHEDWRSSTNVQPSLSAQQLNSGEVSQASEDAVGLKAWEGILSGSERLVALLRLLTTHVEMSTSNIVALRIGAILDLSARLSGVTSPEAKHETSVKPNQQISKEERETMFAILPGIHAAVFEVHLALFKRLGRSSLPFCRSVFEDVSRIYQAERSFAEVRLGAYRVSSHVLSLIGPNFTAADVLEFAPILKACCHDILPDGDHLHTGSRSIASHADTTKQAAEAPSPTLTKTSTEGNPMLKRAASQLLHAAYHGLDAACLPPKIRALMDRTAILAGDKEMLLASVLNPPKRRTDANAQASLLPILATLYPQSPSIEALLRPRMPPLRVEAGSKALGEMLEDSQDESSNDGEVDDDSEPTSGLLNALSRELQLPLDQPVDQGALSAPPPPSETLGPVDPVVIPPGDQYTLNDHVGFKRKIEEESSDGSLTKRLRAPNASHEAQAADSASSSHRIQARGDEAQERVGSDQTSIQNTILVTSLPQMQTAPVTKDKQSASLPAFKTEDGAHDGTRAMIDTTSDDDDFELPPLTMDPDTDAEDSEVD